MRTHRPRTTRRAAKHAAPPALAALLALAPLSHGSSAWAQARVETTPHAHALEARLLAPCCWTQTLDIHDSPTAERLRTELRTRLRSGESASSIEADLAARYGERIRAIPAQHDPRRSLIGTATALLLVATAAAALTVSRWPRRPALRAEAPAVSPSANAVLDARLDAELAALDP